MGATTRGLADMMGVTTQTVRLWIRTGRMPYHTGPSGRAFFTDEDIQKIVNEHSQSDQVWVHYARSSCGSTEAINDQLEMLEHEYGTPHLAIQDRGSGLNEKRKGLNRLLDMSRAGQITDLAITTQDRLTRFGYLYLKRYLEDNGVTIHVLQGLTEKHPEQELIDDFMALLASFSGRYYHLRNNANKVKFMEQVENKVRDEDGDKD
jgi:putative resolvase